MQQELERGVSMKPNVFWNSFFTVQFCHIFFPFHPFSRTPGHLVLHSPSPLPPPFFSGPVASNSNEHTTHASMSQLQGTSTSSRSAPQGQIARDDDGKMKPPSTKSRPRRMTNQSATVASAAPGPTTPTTPVLFMVNRRDGVHTPVSFPVA